MRVFFSFGVDCRTVPERITHNIIVEEIVLNYVLGIKPVFN